MQTRSRLVRLCAVAVIMLAAPNLYGQNLYAQNRTEFELPPQSLAASLRAVGSQTSTNVLFDPLLVEGRDAPALTAELTTALAFERLLAGTGLEHRFLDDKTVVIAAAEKGAGSAAASGNAAGSSKEEGGPNSGNPAAMSTPGRMVQASMQWSTRTEEAQRSTKSEEQGLPIEEIVVTGTNIRGIAPESSPVHVFEREDIEISGASTVEQFLRTIPQNFGGGANPGNTLRISDDGTDSDGIGFGSSVNLRGFGSGTTLTLINGRRISNSGAGSFVDVTLIPLSAVERIEIMTDGASAIYGTDAIGGVVNIVLKQDFRGIDLNGQYGVTTNDGYDQASVGVAAGTTWLSGSAFFAYDYFANQNLLASDRDFAASALHQPFDLMPETARHGLFGALRQNVSRSIRLFLEGLYSKRDTEFTVSIPAFPDSQSLFERGKTEQYGAVGGMKIDLSAKWQGRIEASYSKNSRRNDTIDLATREEVQSAPNNQSSTWYLRAVADGDLFDLPGGDVKLAIGASFRSEDFERFETFRDDREVFAAFSELQIPVVGDSNTLSYVDRLALSLAFRYDDFSDFGDTLNPKVGMLWEISPQFKVRSSYGTSFRAPIFNNLYDGNSLAILANLPDSSSPTGRTMTILALGGNPDLNAEEAETWTAGLEYAPDWSDGLTVKLNYYDVQFDNQIQRPTNNIASVLLEADILAPVLTYDPSPDQIDHFVNIGGLGFQVFRAGPFAVPAEFDESDTEVIADLRLGNISLTHQEGLDIDIDYSTDVGPGALSTGVAANYVFEIQRKITDASPAFDVVGTLYHPTDLSLRGRFGYSLDDFTAVLFINHQSAYEDNISSEQSSPIDAWTTADMTIRYEPSKDFGLLKYTAIALSVQNVTDEDPPFVQNLRGTGFDPTNANPFGRLVTLSVRRHF